MKTLLAFIPILALFSCTAQSEEKSGLTFNKETMERYTIQRRNKDSAAYYYEQKLKHLEHINLYDIIPDYLTKKDSEALLLVTSEGCIGCNYMQEIMDSVAVDYPSLKLLEFTPNTIRDINYFHPDRFIGRNKMLYDTLLSWGYPRLYFIKGGVVQAFTEGGPSDRTKLHYLKKVESKMAKTLGLPNRRKDFVIESKPYEGSIYLEGGIILSFVVEDFDAHKNKLDTCGNGQEHTWICIINGNEWYGSDNGLSLPKTQLSELSITLDDIEIPLETSGMYNVNYQWVSTRQFQIDSLGSKYTLSAGFSDGAGYYVAKWEIENGVAKRVLLSNDEEDF